MACDVFSSYVGSGIVLTRDFYLVYFIIISVLLDSFCMKKFKFYRITQYKSYVFPGRIVFYRGFDLEEP